MAGLTSLITGTGSAISNAAPTLSSASSKAKDIAQFLPFLQLLQQQQQMNSQPIQQQQAQLAGQQPKPPGPQIQFPSINAATGGDPNIGAKQPSNIAIQQLLKLLLSGQGQGGGLS